MKNKLVDMNNILFEQLERLNDDDCDIEKEIKKAKALCEVSSQIINVASTQLEAIKVAESCNYLMQDMPELFQPTKKAISMQVK